ncbi:MAG: hypothetical protein BIFFINMI_01992 [Phycisphaerae bacterium]|nr:hypothetical protein [Phycisphaerae bacterium]
MTQSTRSIARDVWVRTDRWPDPKDLGRWARDIFRIARARTGEQRALALFDWTLICVARGGPACHEGPRGHEAYLMDTLKYLVVYGGNYCDGVSRLMVNAWQAAGAGAGRKIVFNRLGHTIAELRYRDADGRTRWHAFDPQQGWWVRLAGDGPIASLDDIDAAPDLLLSPRTPPPLFFFSDRSIDRYRDRERSTAFRVVGQSPSPRHRMRMDLRPGMCWRRTWRPGPQYWPYRLAAERHTVVYPWVDRDSLGRPIGRLPLGRHVAPYLQPTPADAWIGGMKARPRRCRLAGMSELSWCVPLAGAGLRLAAESAHGLTGEARPTAARALLHPSATGRVGVAVLRVASPYLISDAEIRAVARCGTDPLDMVGIHISIDGGASWTQVGGNLFEQRGRLSARPRKLVAAIGREARDAGGFSVAGRYDYLVRIDLLARHDAGAVGLDDLTITTRCICNMMALPMLLPGDNRVTVTASGNGRLKVGYRWREKARGLRTAARTLPPGGGTFAVRVGGCEPADARMEEVTVECL